MTDQQKDDFDKILESAAEHNRKLREAEDVRIDSGNYTPICVIDYDYVEKTYSAREQRWSNLTNGQRFIIIGSKFTNTVKGRYVYEAVGNPFLQLVDTISINTKHVGYFNEATNEFTELEDDELNEDKSEG